MADNNIRSYEELYGQLFDRAESLHESNKRRIRRGMIGLVVLPVVLSIIRILTDSNKIVFLIIWIICMFVLSAFLITIEYIDDAIQKTLYQLTDQEAGFDDLLVKPEPLQIRVLERLNIMRAMRSQLEELEESNTITPEPEHEEPEHEEPETKEEIGGAE